MNFSDMLNQPLPSFFESADSEFDDIFSMDEGCSKEGRGSWCSDDSVCTEEDDCVGPDCWYKTEDDDDDDDDKEDKDDDDEDECFGPECSHKSHIASLFDSEDDEDDDDDIESDLAQLSDDELDQLAQDISDSDIDDLSGDVEPVDLTPEEEAEADDLMSVAATTELIRSEMNNEDRAKFVESADDIKRAVQEGFLLESDIDELAASVQPVTEATWYATKQRIQLGKEARMKQLWTIAVQVSARAHNDPDYKKLQKIYKLKRLYRSRLEKKYNAEATKRMRVYIARLKKSKSKPLNDLGKKIVK